ncbi:MAG: oligosaccharide flippase family protein [Clostridium sp.]|nr:oligosaccharide flippase family protein [Clostridium sp.]
MRTRSSLLTFTVSCVGQLINVVLLFTSRRLFVQHFTQEYLGVNGLFSNILTVLSLAELGIGIAMLYGLYKPAANGDRTEICRLMNLYRVLYGIVGIVVLALGLILMPALPYFVQGGDGLQLRLIYGMYLFDTVAGYFLSYKQAILTANQEAWRTTAVTQAVRSVQILLQMIVIVCLENFYVYLAIQMCSQLTANLILSRIVDRRYPYLKNNRKGYPSRESCKDIFRQVGALSIHRLGGVLVSHTDNIIISTFQGLATVGIYSNYQMVLNSIRVMTAYVYNSFSPAIGNLAASKEKKRICEIHSVLDFLLSLLYGWLALCMIVLFNPFIRLFFGEHYVLPSLTMLLIVVDFYLHGMRQMTLRFRDGMGLYWYDRYKPIAEALLNLVVSIALVGRFGIAGVVTGTIVSTLLTNFWVEPLVFFRYGVMEGWKGKFAKYYIWRAAHTAVLVIDSVILWALHIRFPIQRFIDWIFWGILCTFLYGLTVLLAFYRTKEWRYLWAKGVEQWGFLKKCLQKI